MRFLNVFLALSVFMLASVQLSSAAHSERRVALVVGNGAYAHATRLQNPVNDATDVTAKLEKLGFDVTLATDLGSDAFFDAIQAYSTKLAGADIALFYYSGHGVQFDGTNYLVPTDTKVDGQFALKRKAVSAQDVVEQMERGAKVSLVFLDACRNNSLLRDLEQSLPAQSRGTAAGRGLARMDAKGSNTLIVFATAPNDVASDGTGGRNSPFTAALLKHIEDPGVVIQEMLTDVTAEVERSTNGRQKPELLARLTSKVRLAAAAVPVSPQSTSAVIPPPIANSPSKEREASVAWEAVQSTCDRDRLTMYRERYIDTFYGDLAQRRLDDIRAGAACAAVDARLQKLPIVSVHPIDVVKPETNDPALARALQTELARVGCYKSNADGRWGKSSAAALRAYGHYTGATFEPTQIALDALKHAGARICPLTCDANEHEMNGQCVPKTAGVQNRPLTKQCDPDENLANGKCISRKAPKTSHASAEPATGIKGDSSGRSLGGTCVNILSSRDCVAADGRICVWRSGERVCDK